MPSLTLADHAIYYEVHGQGHPLVLISGLGTSHLFWWKQIAPLSAHFRLITLDNRGIADSSRVQAAFSIADMADDVAALIDHLKLGACFVLGISMGGFVAATFALRHAGRVRKLILASTSAGGPKHKVASAEILKMLIDTGGQDPEAYTRLVYTALAGTGYMQKHPEDLDRIVANALAKPLSPETYLYQLNAINGYMTTDGVDDALDRIDVPTLVLHGDADPLVPLANGQNVARKIKKADLKIYPGGGHLPPIEVTTRFNGDVLDFLNAPTP
ncbi:MAG: alpha/beta fold hydrolase [Desulfobacterales bacterium]|nr:alpha/beta fold hydrolase [Desulfobacterales bacterium]